jgi:hypothetical protein
MMLYLILLLIRFTPTIAVTSYSFSVLLNGLGIGTSSCVTSTTITSDQIVATMIGACQVGALSLCEVIRTGDSPITYTGSDCTNCQFSLGSGHSSEADYNIWSHLQFNFGKDRVIDYIYEPCPNLNSLMPSVQPTTGTPTISYKPTAIPTIQPTVSYKPTSTPTAAPSATPTSKPTTLLPTRAPTLAPTAFPTFFVGSNITRNLLNSELYQKISQDFDFLY